MKEKESKYRRIVPAPRKRASLLSHDSIRPAEMRLKTILDAATDGHWRWNLSSGEVRYSEAWLELMGYTPANAPETGAFLGPLVHDDDRVEFNASLQSHLDGHVGVFDCECRLRAHDGDYRWFRIRGKIVRRDKLGRPVSMVGTFLGIQAQKLARLDLDRSRTLLSDAFDLCEDCVWIVDPDSFELVAFNSAIDDFIFKLRGVHLRPGMRLEEINPERAEAWKLSYKNVLKHGRLEWDYEFLSGPQTFHFVAQLLERDGRARAICVFGQDVTRSRQIEKALRKSEEKFSKAFHLSPVTYTLTSFGDGRYIEVNEAFEEGTGYKREDVIGKTASEIALWLHPEQRLQLLEQLKIAGQIRNAEIMYRTSAGEVREALASAVLIEVDGEPQVLSVVVDITAQKRALEALRDSEERLRIAIESRPMYAFDWDVQSDLVHCHENSERILGLGKGAGQPSKAQFVEYVHPEDRGFYLDTLESLTPEKPSYKMTFRFLRRDAKMIWLEESGRAIFAPDGKLRKVIGMMLDVTEPRQSERALRDLSGRLITSQEEERRRVARELHDHIGQELALLCVQAQRIDSGVSDEEHTTQIDVHELYRRIKEIAVDVSKLSHRLHSSELDFLGLAVAAERLCRDFANQHGMDLDYQIKKVPPRLDGGKALCFYRVLQESLQNVAKHSHATRVVVELLGKENELTLKIADNGVGFDLENVRFASGLGLVSMRERLNLIGGKLELRSEQGSGTQLIATVAVPGEAVR